MDVKICDSLSYGKTACETVVGGLNGVINSVSSFEMPKFEMPKFEMPKFEMPKFKMPPFCEDGAESTICKTISSLNEQLTELSKNTYVAQGLGYLNQSLGTVGSVDVTVGHVTLALAALGVARKVLTPCTVEVRSLANGRDGRI